MDNIINPNQQKMVIDGNAVIGDFFAGFFNRMVVETFKVVWPPDEREERLDAWYKDQMAQFESFLRDLQIHDLGGYMKIKGAIEQTFNNIKKAIIEEKNVVVQE